MRDRRSLNINIQQPEANQPFKTQNTFACVSGSQGSTALLKKQTSVSTYNGGSAYQQRRQTPLPFDYTTSEQTPCREISEEIEQFPHKFALTSVKAKPKHVKVVPQPKQCIWLPERIDNQPQPQGFRKPAPPPKTCRAKQRFNFLPSAESATQHQACQPINMSDYVYTHQPRHVSKPQQQPLRIARRPQRQTIYTLQPREINQEETSLLLQAGSKRVETRSNVTHASPRRFRQRLESKLPSVQPKSLLYQEKRTTLKLVDTQHNHQATSICLGSDGEGSADSMVNMLVDMKPSNLQVDLLPDSIQPLPAETTASKPVLQTLRQRPRLSIKKAHPSHLSQTPTKTLAAAAVDTKPDTEREKKVADQLINSLKKQTRAVICHNEKSYRPITKPERQEKIQVGFGEQWNMLVASLPQFQQQPEHQASLINQTTNFIKARDLLKP